MESKNPNPGKPILMPGPQFEKLDYKKPWWKLHSQKIIYGVIITLLVIGGFSLYRSYQNKKTLLSSALQDIIRSSSPTPTGQNLAVGDDLTVQNDELTGRPATTQAVATSETIQAAPTVEKQNSGLTVKAEKGNGVTHLARQALKEYLTDKPELQNQLKAEHKIYIEDYLRKHSETPKTLHPGDEITFSNQLIDEAIAQAQTLNQNQINNLHQYALLVPSL